jgi:hypothetical protein
MGSGRDSKTREIASLQLQLAKASQLLDQLEKRSRQRACQMAQVNSTTSMAENAELRFARYVASGMTKLEVR